MIHTFGARGENPYVNDYFHKFYDELFFPYLKDNNIKTIVHLGDVVDRRKFMNFSVWNSWRTKFFDRINNEKDMTLHILLGNHDIYHKNTSDINAMDELVGSYPCVKIYRNATEVLMDGIPYIFIPWINSSNEEHTFKTIQETRATIAFGHLEIQGFEMDRGNICKTGYNRSLFNKFEKVYTGHFHHKSDDGHIYYLGNQYEITWADYGDVRGFHVFDTETQNIEYIENPFKLFHKITYSDDIMNFEYWKKFDFSIYAKTYVKVVVLKKGNPYLLDTVLESLSKIDPIDISVFEDYSEIEEEEIKVDQAEDVTTILSKYIDSQSTDLDKNILKLLIKEIYIEALNSEVTS